MSDGVGNQGRAQSDLLCKTHLNYNDYISRYTKTMQTIILFSRDLFFRSKVLGTAAELGAEAKSVRSLEQLAELVNASTQELTIIVDLQMEQAVPEAVVAVTQAASTGTVLIGYYSHVEHEVGARAKAAGFSQVLAKSQFVKLLPDIIAKAPLLSKPNL